MIASGVQWRRLAAEGIDRLQGAGIYYGGGATEALACKGETVYVVGGANSAGQAAVYLASQTSAVMANMFTDALPPNTTLSAASALIIRLFFLSCSSFFLM